MGKRSADAKRTNMFSKSREQIAPQPKHHEDNVSTISEPVPAKESVKEEYILAEPAQTEAPTQVKEEIQKQPEKSVPVSDIMNLPVKTDQKSQEQKINNRTVAPTVEIPMDITDIPLKKERGRNISIFFSPEELEFLETYPKAHGMKKSAFVSALVRKYMESLK